MRRFYIAVFALLVTLVAAGHLPADQVDNPANCQFTRIELEARTNKRSAKEVVLGEINGDGKLDALIVTSSLVSVWIGDGEGNFAESDSFSISDRIGYIDLIDLESDGVVDAVIDGVLWRNDGLGVFTESHPLFREHKHLRYSDLNNDGHIDAVVVRPPTIFWNKGDGHFIEQNLQVKCEQMFVRAIADLDQDLHSDLIVVGKEGARCVLNSSGRFDTLVTIDLRGNVEELASFKALK